VATVAIERTWDGRAAQQGEWARLDVGLSGERLLIRVDAPYHGDPLPPCSPGSCEGLWEYEVVELFLLGEREHYLEIELGPGGHSLVLELNGRRRRARAPLPLRYRCERRGERWLGEASLPRGELPAGLRAWNAYAIHGCGAERRYLAFQPVPGERPDFHRLECFAPLPSSLRAELESARSAAGE
jgi:hypothetical protein